MDDCSHGPVSTMPGSHHSLEPGSKCDSHPERLAVARVQGETDSFGCEYLCMCQQCLVEYRAHQKAEYERAQHCDWCKQEKTGCHETRDYDEGSAGPLYMVCRDCRNKRDDEARRELEASYDYDDYFD